MTEPYYESFKGGSSQVDIVKEQQLVSGSDFSLALDLDDDLLNEGLNSKIRESRQHFEAKLKWIEVMEQNEKIWLGQQIDPDKIYEWQIPEVVNVIFRNIESIVPIAVARVPQPQVEPAQNTQQSHSLAADLEKSLLYRFDRGIDFRSILRESIRHLLIYRLGVIKWFWDSNISDFNFRSIRPSKLYAFDHTTSDPHKLGFVCENVSDPAVVLANKFPGSKEEVFARENITRASEENKDIPYQEIWFTYYDQKGNPQEAVVWRYKDTILAKMKSPNWDWEGRQEETIGEMGETISETVQYNFLDYPYKPYIFLNYLNLGKQIVDDTSLLEQAWPEQQVVNKRSMQISDMGARAQGKLAVSTEFVASEEQDRLSPDPDEHILGTGDVRSGVSHIPGQPPSPVLLADKNQHLAEIDNIMGTHSTTRGERKEQETLGGRVLLREADYGRVGDLTLKAVDSAAKEAYQAAMHLVRLRYTEAHHAKVSGERGRFDFIEFSRNSVEKGMAVNVVPGSSLPVDNIFRRNEAMELAARKLITPDDLYERLGWDNPKETALKVMVFNSDPMLYAQILVSGQSFVEYMSQAAQAPAQPESPQVPQQPPAAAGAQIAGADVADVAQRTTAALAKMRQFAQSPEFQQLSPEQQKAFIEEMRKMAEQAKGLIGE